MSAAVSIVASIVESRILCYLLNSLWQLPLLLAAGWLAARALRPLGAAVEHRCWLAVLLLQTMLPAASILPAEILGGLAKVFAFPVFVFPVFAFLARTPQSADAQVSVTIDAGSGLAALPLPPPLLAAIALAYAAATAYLAARFLWRCLQLRTLRRESTPIALLGEAAICWAQCLRQFGFDRVGTDGVGQVGIASSALIGSPVAIGLRRKRLLLPAIMAESIAGGLAGGDLRAILAHEFAHLRRNDFLKNLLYELLCLPVGYHPALWFVRERVTESREIVCDQIAAPIASLAATVADARHDYAHSLLRLASMLATDMPARPPPHAIGILDANAFERRLMLLTQPPTRIRGASRFARVAACAALGLATCASALALRLSVNALPALPTALNDKPAPATAESLAVPAGVMAGNAVDKVTPKYPADAKKARIQGTVLLDAVIGKDGTIKKLTVVSGPKELQQSALDAVGKWSYKPYLLNGDPVEVKTTVSVVYSLGK